MHEISIMQSTLELAEEHARKGGGTAIARIRLRVGLISGVVPEALEFAFDVLKKGTMAEEASLEIERVPGDARCQVCGNNVRLDEVRFDCPDCNGMLILGDAGGDLELSHLVLA
jgi:hydrogenase nickel incorporation protein HypA/HybF